MDTFLSKMKCDRCGGDLKVRTMSWFTEETICMKCSDKESDIKTQLIADLGHSMEGCGFIPDIDNITA